jgi:hypothetical protein
VVTLPSFAALALGAFAALHPMHTSVAELTPSPAGFVVVTLRIFADDFKTVVPNGTVQEAEPYIRARLELRDPQNRPITLAWGEVTQAGDVVQIRLRAELRSGLSGVRVRDLLLCERFADQVNIVRATYGGRTASLLFTAGDEAKALP